MYVECPLQNPNVRTSSNSTIMAYRSIGRSRLKISSLRLDTSLVVGTCFFFTVEPVSRVAWTFLYRGFSLIFLSMPVGGALLRRTPALDPEANDMVTDVSFPSLV